MAMEPSDWDEERINEQIGESGEVNCLKTNGGQFYLETLIRKTVRQICSFISLKYSPAMLLRF